MQILSNDTITREDISQVLNGSAAVLRIRDYYPESTCENLADALTNSPLMGNYSNAPKIGRVGMAYFEAIESAEAMNEYYQNAVGWIQELRKSCRPYALPTDRVRLELDEVWPQGAHLARIDGQKMFAGLARVFLSGGDAEPHQDDLRWDAPGSTLANNIQEQLAVNIYLRMPEEGGELYIWPRSLTKEEYLELGIEGSYGIHADKLNASPIILQPIVGELIIFNSHLVHAVTATEQGQRISMSCFVGFSSDRHPLFVWS